MTERPGADSGRFAPDHGGDAVGLETRNRNWAWRSNREGIDVNCNNRTTGSGFCRVISDAEIEVD